MRQKQAENGSYNFELLLTAVIMIQYLLKIISLILFSIKKLYEWLHLVWFLDFNSGKKSHKKNVPATTVIELDIK